MNQLLWGRTTCPQADERRVEEREELHRKFYFYSFSWQILYLIHAMRVDGVVELGAFLL